LSGSGRRGARLYNGGTVFLMSGSYDAAVEWLAAAVNECPDWPEAHHNLGLALMGAHFREEALAAFDQAITLKPRFAEAHNNRGRVLVGLGRYPEALASFDLALAIRPDYTKAAENRQLCAEWMEADQERPRTPNLE
jgi:Tfp pilus assembly protein PilF